jgi:nucleotide-binding universal stress UspA family protein
MSEAAPVIVGYDGSDLAKAALRHAAALFAGRPALIATVWEPGIALATVGPPDSFGFGSLPPDQDTIQAVDRAQREHATQVAEEGAELARSLGLDAEPHPVPDEVDIADTLIALASERNAAVVVVGSHGISGVRSHLLGRASRRLIEHCRRPVLVIRGDD